MQSQINTSDIIAVSHLVKRFGDFTAVNDENAANPLVNLITLPQFLLAGTFFPIDNLPTWIAPIANNLPLSYFNTAVRKITTEGGSFTDTFPYLSV